MGRYRREIASATAISPKMDKKSNISFVWFSQVVQMQTLDKVGN